MAPKAMTPQRENFTQVATPLRDMLCAPVATEASMTTMQNWANESKSIQSTVVWNLAANTAKRVSKVIAPLHSSICQSNSACRASVNNMTL